MGGASAVMGTMWRCGCESWVVGAVKCPHCFTTRREHQTGAKPAFWSRAFGRPRRPSSRTAQTAGQRLYVLCAACRHMNWYMLSTVRDLRSFQTVCEHCGSAARCEGSEPAPRNTPEALRRQVQPTR